MNKLRLHLEDLAVESFDTVRGRQAERGTVHGNDACCCCCCPCCCSGAASCGGTCDASACNGSCVNTCAASCNGTCASCDASACYGSCAYTCDYSCDPYVCGYGSYGGGTEGTRRDEIRLEQPVCY
jgi:hypothetical protein